MPEKNVVPDKVWGMKIGGVDQQIQLSQATSDHAVRYPSAIGYLDHLVVLSPVQAETEDGRDIHLHFVQRYFLGATAVEQVVQTTGIGEVYYDSVTQSVYDDYQEQQSGDIGDDIDHILNNFDINTDE